MSKYIPVDPEKWAKMVQAQSDLPRWKKMCDELDARCNELKAEVERLKEGNDCLDKMHEKEMARSAYLCEEVNRTTAWGRGLESDLSHARVEISFLKAEVERLRMAGDALVEALKDMDVITDMDSNHPEVDAWNAAKEGKPSV